MPKSIDHIIQRFTVFFVIAAGFTAGLAGAATINKIQSGRHQGYSLLVVSADQDLTYTLREEGGRVTVVFPRGTICDIRPADLSGIKDDFFRSLTFDPVNGVLTLELGKNYRLRTYENRRPFQLVMDFTRLTGTPQKRPAESVAKPIKPELKPESEVIQPLKQDDSDPDSITDPFKKGLAFKKIGEYQQALTAFEAAVPRNGESARFQIALVYEEMNQREKAIESLLELINRSPNWIEPRLKLGMLYKLSGRDGLAEKLWAQILEVLEADTSYNFSSLQPQIDYLEQLLVAEGEDLEDSMPALNTSVLPDLPWKWIFIILGIGGSVIAVRLITNWRMNRLISSIYNESDEYDGDLAPDGEIDVSHLGDLHQPEDHHDEDLSDFIEAANNDQIPPELGGSEEMTEEKQQMIYDLLDQKYSIAEIAKMLDMGQEEVKFIIDFRSKSDE